MKHRENSISYISSSLSIDRGSGFQENSQNTRNQESSLQEPTAPTLEESVEKKPILSDFILSRLQSILHSLRGTDNVVKWMVVKVALLRSIRAVERGKFSRRHPQSKKQVPNEYDYAVMEAWENLGGKPLELLPEELHDESSHIYLGRGYGLREWHKKQRKLKHSEASDL